MSRRGEVPGRLIPGIVAALLVTLAVHWTLGWAWTVLGGAAGGWLAPRRGWLAGAAGTGTGWALSVAASFLVDARAVSEMTRVVGALLGGLPGAATVALTIAIGVLLGAAGGLVGHSARNIVRPVGR